MPAVPPERPLPEEIPWREVEHDSPPDEGDPGSVDHWPSMLGAVRDEDFYGWESDEAEDEWWAERARKDASRKKLGGFGFCANRV